MVRYSYEDLLKGIDEQPRTLAEVIERAFSGLSDYERRSIKVGCYKLVDRAIRKGDISSHTEYIEGKGRTRFFYKGPLKEPASKVVPLRERILLACDDEWHRTRIIAERVYGQDCTEREMGRVQHNLTFMAENGMVDSRFTRIGRYKSLTKEWKLHR